MPHALMRLLGPVAAVVFVAMSAPAFATTQRTFVASSGSDANPCSIVQPCRTFAQAITQTSVGGELVALTSGGYGTITIGKSIAILAPTGVYAGVTATGGATGITVNAGPSDVVTIRGLAINGIGGGDGIAFNSGGMLEIEGTEVSGFNGANKAGLHVQAVGRLFVRDSTFRDNYHGVFIEGATGKVLASLDRVNLTHNASVGLYVVNGGAVTITNSVASGNAYGIDAQTVDGSTQLASIAVESCHVANNTQDGIVIGGYGVFPAQLPYITVSGSVVADNGGYGMHGLHALNYNLILSRQNNTVVGNQAGSLLMVDPLSAM